MEIQLGTIGRSEAVVARENTAIAAGSGTLAVFGTPYMLALMENAASVSVTPCLEEGQTTVGTYLNVEHLSATPVGMRVWAESEVIAVDGRSITFLVKAYDQAGVIGSGEHRRVIVDAERFLEKCRRKGNER